jgi:phage head maturation protease
MERRKRMKGTGRMASQPQTPTMTRDEFLSPRTLRTRSDRLKISKSEEGSRVVELSFSSETPVRMYDWWNDREYDEILGHAKGNVDLSRLNEIGVALYNHNPNDVRNVVGRVVEAWVDEDARKCRARVEFDADESADLVFQKVKSGTIRGVSVGYRVNRWEQVDEGATTSDGIEGPAMIGREWTAFEISFAPIPADPTVGAGRSIDLNGGGDMTKEELERMRKKKSEEEEDKEPDKEETKKKSKREDDDEKDDDERDDDEKDDDEKDDERKLAGERRRAAQIAETCGHFGIDPAGYIRSGATLAEVNSAILKKMRAERKPLETSGSASAVSVNRDEREKFRSAVVDGLAMRSGVKLDKTSPGAEDFRRISLLDLCRMVLERDGQRVGWGDDKTEIARRAFSTSDFPLLLSNLADKVLLAGYQEAPATWRSWCATGSLKDFKESYKLRMSEAPVLEPVLEGGEYKMADFAESEDSYRIGTWGKKFSLTRQLIINDDLGAFTRIPALFGVAAGRTINQTVYGLLLKNPVLKEDEKALFHADHHNIGTAGPLSIASLTEARTLMRRQKGMRKDPGVFLNLSPSILLIPPELETAARQLLFSTADIGQSNPAVINPFHGSLEIVVDATLTSPSAWYLIASPSVIDTMEVAFLDGAQNPVVEQQQGWNTDGIEYKVRLDFGVKAWDYRGIFKNAGA